MMWQNLSSQPITSNDVHWSDPAHGHPATWPGPSEGHYLTLYINFYLSSFFLGYLQGRFKKRNTAVGVSKSVMPTSEGIMFRKMLTIIFSQGPTKNYKIKVRWFLHPVQPLCTHPHTHTHIYHNLGSASTLTK